MGRFNTLVTIPLTTYIHSRKAKENTWAAGGEAGRHHAYMEQGKSGYKVGYGNTWGYSPGSLGLIRKTFFMGHQYWCSGQIFPDHVFFASYTLLAAIIPNPVLPMHITTHLLHIIMSSSCNAITHYNVVFITTLSSPHFVMPLRITTLFSSPHYH